MFDLEKAVKEWKRALQKHESLEQGLVADLELQLRDTFEALKGEGLGEEEAFRTAAAKLGPPEAIAAEYRKNRSLALDRRRPWRPGRFMPALAWNYWKTAGRKIGRQKGYAFINVAGLAIGLAVCMLISLWVLDELGFDRFHRNIDRIFRVYLDESATAPGSASALTPPPMAAALKQNFPEVLRSTRFGTWQKRLVSVGDKSFTETKYMHVDPDFFAMFSFPFVKGDPASAFAAPYSVVLTEAAAEKYFGSEDPMGKTLNVDHAFDVVVTGVLRNVPVGSSLEFDLLSPFEVLLKQDIGEKNRDNWGFNSFSTFVMLPDESAGPRLGRNIAGYVTTIEPEDADKLALQPLSAIHLRSGLSHDYSNKGDIKYVWIFGALAVFILAIACVNFMNLATARSANRAREVGLRKVVGATRPQLVRQFFAESVLMAVLSFAFAVILLELLIRPFNAVAAKHLPSALKMGPPVLLGFFGLALVTGLVAGTYPAIFLSAFRPAAVLKGTLRSAGSNPLLRRALVIFQFSLSVFLIAGTAVISRQLSYMMKLDLGFQRERVVRLSLYGDFLKKYETIREQFLRNPDVLGVTASLSLPTNIMNSPGTPEWEGKNPDEQLEIKADFVDYDYLETFGIPLVEGRSFSRDMATDAETAFIINEEAVRRMRLAPPVVGKTFGFWGIKGQIIGVMKDAHLQSLHHKIEPMVFKVFPDWFRTMYVKVRSGDIQASLASLKTTWEGLKLGYPFEARFLDDDFENLYRTEQRLGAIFRYFAALAVFIGCLGLLGLASFMAEQKAKEIGIRKVLGASVSGVTLMMSGQFVKWVLAANLIALPAAWVIMGRWLGGFAYRTEIGIGIFLLSAGLSLGLALLTVAYQSIRAARGNPVVALRQET
jgi:ABC-type antimicrobial peptide transport system permease subunit